VVRQLILDILAPARTPIKAPGRGLRACLRGFCLILSVLFAAPAPAQPVASGTARSGNRFGLALGVPYLQLRDQIVSPLRWSGFGGGCGFTYERLGAVSRHRTELKVSLGMIANRYRHLGGTADFRLGYDYVRRVATARVFGTTFVGGSLQWESALQFYVQWDEEHLYWATAYGLGPVVQHEIRLAPQRRLAFRVAFPLVSLVARPPGHRYYKIDDLMNIGFYFSRPNEDLRLATVDEYRSLAASVLYLFSLTASWQFGALYEFGYSRFNQPEPIQVLLNSLSARAIHAF
jgi:hypothetical protein